MSSHEQCGLRLHGMGLLRLQLRHARTTMLGVNVAVRQVVDVCKGEAHQRRRRMTSYVADILPAHDGVHERLHQLSQVFRDSAPRVGELRVLEGYDLHVVVVLPIDQRVEAEGARIGVDLGLPASLCEAQSAVETGQEVAEAVVPVERVEGRQEGRVVLLRSFHNLLAQRVVAQDARHEVCIIPACGHQTNGQLRVTALTERLGHVVRLEEILVKHLLYAKSGNGHDRRSR
mmetsp:Transcript_56945/g.123257  ORF Transcript_56945/g.123257 Transcript_56945/m.123257 type:complete len:231 (+) Transcript_56945:61-753(+)